MTSKKNVIVSNRLSPELVDQLREHHHVITLEPGEAGERQFAEALPQAHGLIGAGRKLGREQLASATQLEVLSSVSVGYDSYDVGYLTERGIKLTNTPDVLTDTTADLGFTLLMSAARRVAELDAYVKAGKWVASADASLFGTDIHHKTLGIIGMGRIGAAVAKRGHFGFDMRILYQANSRKPELERDMGAEYRELDDLLREADFVCVVVPLGEKTRHLIGARELGLMKSSAILINIARGPVVDEAALIQALRDKAIRGAGLDVFEEEPLPADSPLRELANAVTLPHIGSATVETRRAMDQRAVDNLLAALRGEEPRDWVNRT